ncbi:MULTISPECIES: carboxymuconolactone decarboxylase family protein [Nonomuraea]|uniref:Carboxymuconolactone decarboxylase family protein n=1 Tax=Nonomuraea salmonea TaxID=46181 RepID=A0ABV5P0Q1_9ACTN
MRMDVSRSAAAGYKGMYAVEAYIGSGPVPRSTLELLRLRVSQINGCAFCIDMHVKEGIEAGVPERKLHAVAAWRDTPYFSDEERAALALAEAATRIADNPEGVPDDVWDAAADLYDEESLAVLVMAIAAINTWNRLNVTVRKGPAE